MELRSIVCYSLRSMRPQKLVLLLAALVITGSFLGSLPMSDLVSESALGLSYTPTHGGHLGKFYSDCFTVVCVSNNTPSRIAAVLPTVEREEADGRVVTLPGQRWNGELHEVAVPPRGAVSLPVEIRADTVRFRVSFYYERSAGRLAASACRVLRFAPIQALPLNLQMWFFEHGLVDGSLRRTYAGRWVSVNEVRAGKGHQWKDELPRVPLLSAGQAAAKSIQD
jgi:hypothetical protein